MANRNRKDNQKGILQSLDWWTIAIYLALLVFGWVSVCGASYTYGDTRILYTSDAADDPTSCTPLTRPTLT